MAFKSRKRKCAVNVNMTFKATTRQGGIYINMALKRERENKCVIYTQTNNISMNE